jgi:hypothetical protein
VTDTTTEAVTLTLDDCDAFTIAYLECALWSSTDESRDDGGDPLDDNYGLDDIAPEALETAINDCESFQETCAADLEASGLSSEQAGHDFWLTRNGHGAGFWDRGLGAIGERLSKASKPYGSADLYVGADGQIYGF